MVWAVPHVNTGKMLELFAKVRCFTVNWRVTVEVKYHISKKISSGEFLQFRLVCKNFTVQKFVFISELLRIA